MIRDAPNSLLDGAQEAQRLFHKPIFVSDVALSSHGGPQYEQAQADAIRGLFELAPRLREAGVHAIVYRSILDNPSADTSDYYGEAEKHFGLVWTTNRTTKPAFEALVDALTTDAEPAVRPPELATNSRQDDGPLAGLPFDGVETLASDLEAPRADAVPPPWSADLLAQAAAT
jgi:hypothetical protein